MSQSSLRDEQNISDVFIELSLKNTVYTGKGEAVRTHD